MAKYVDLEALRAFKTKQDARTAATYAAKSSVPTKVSALANDSGYQTSSQVSSSISSALTGYSKSDHTHSAATASAAGLMSASDKSKLDGITASADTVSFSRSLTSGTKVGTITINGTGTDLYAPTNTDTTYSAATSSAAGLMSASDKSKLDGIAAGANNYTYTLPTASGSTLGGVKTTSSVTSNSGYTACPIISGVPYYKDTNSTYTLSSFGVTATAAELNALDGITATVTELNYMDGVTSNVQTQLNGKAASGHSHSDATTSAAGFMTAAMVTKLNGIAAGANAYSLPTASASTLGGVKTGSNITNSSGTISLTKANVTSALGYTPPTTNTTYSVATASANGLMSSTDKSKLDGIGSISLTEIDALFA